MTNTMRFILKFMLIYSWGGVIRAHNLSAQIDTGAEICLIHKGLVNPNNSLKAEQPVRLIAANQQRLDGVEKEALVTMASSGMNQKLGNSSI